MASNGHPRVNAVHLVGEEANAIGSRWPSESAEAQTKRELMAGMRRPTGEQIDSAADGRHPVGVETEPEANREVGFTAINASAGKHQF